MVTELITERQQAHPLIDLLPTEKLAAVRGLLAVMVDPVAYAIANAPLDDEELTEEDLADLVEGEEWSKHNVPIPHAQVLAELGITEEEIRNYRETA